MTPTTASHSPTGATAAPPRQMHAVTQDAWGADSLAVRTVDLPDIGPEDVLVEVHAAGLDRGVWHLVNGLPYLIRVAGFGFRKPKNPVPGMDLAGRVVAVGDEVTRFRPGDSVFGIGKGTFAEYAVADQAKLVTRPAAITDEQAAIATISGITALQALTDVGHVQPGQSVLVIGASGGVGTYAVQIAKAHGATVTAVSGPRGTGTLHDIGADRVVDYTQESVFAMDERYDLVVDIGGRNGLRRLRSILTATGALVIVGGEGGNRITGGFGRQLRAMLLSPFVSQRLTTFVSPEDTKSIERLAEHMARGEVVPVIDERFGLEDVPAALRRMETGHAKGKSVIVVRG